MAAPTVFIYDDALDSDFFREGGPSKDFHDLWKAGVDQSIILQISNEHQEKINVYLRNLDSDSTVQNRYGLLNKVLGFFDPYKLNQKNFNDNVHYVPTRSTRGIWLHANYLISSNLEQVKDELNEISKEKERKEEIEEQKILKKLRKIDKTPSFSKIESGSKNSSSAPKLMTLESFSHTLMLKAPNRQADSKIEDHQPDDLTELLGNLLTQSKRLDIVEAFQLLFLVYLLYLKGIITQQRYSESSDTIALYYPRPSQSTYNALSNLISSTEKRLRNSPVRSGKIISHAKKILGNLTRLVQNNSVNRASPFLVKSFNDNEFLSILTGILLILDIFQKHLPNILDDSYLISSNSFLLRDIQDAAVDEVTRKVLNANADTLDRETVLVNRKVLAWVVRILKTEIFSRPFTAKRSLEIGDSKDQRKVQPVYLSHIVNILDVSPTSGNSAQPIIPNNPDVLPTSGNSAQPIIPNSPDVLPTSGNSVQLVIPNSPDVPPTSGGNSVQPIALDFTLLYGDGNANVISGSSSHDRIVGRFGDDHLLGQDGNDHLIGGLGNDVLQGGLGADVLEGGPGSDTASYADADSAIEIDLQTGLQIGEAANDTFISIEGIEATAHNDRVRGDENNNSIHGLDGNDILSGRDGNDQIHGGGGTDHIRGGNDNDTLSGGIGNDEIFGDDGDDLIRGDLNRADTQDEILGGNDTLHGGNGNDRIGGKTGDDRIYGDDGNDELWGGDGNDELWGGDGNDNLTGLSGADAFLFPSSTEGVDMIIDFSQHEKDIVKISRQGFSHDLALGTLDAGAFALGAATDLNDRFIYESGTLFFDPDGTGAQAAIKFAIFSNKTSLSHSDIFII